MGSGAGPLSCGAALLGCPLLLFAFVAVQKLHDAVRCIFGVCGKLALPSALTGCPPETVLFEHGAGFVVRLSGKDELHAHDFVVLAVGVAVVLILDGAGCCCGLCFVEFVKAGLNPLDLTADAGQLKIAVGLAVQAH